MNKIPFVINCEQLDLDRSPDESWVLRKVNGKSHLQRMISVILESDLFSMVCLFVPKNELYKVYHNFSDSNVTIVEVDPSDYRLRTQDMNRTWNTFIPVYEVCAVWSYQLAKLMNVDFVYSIDAYSILPDKNSIKEALDYAWSNPDHMVGVYGMGGIQGLIFPVKYLEKNYYKDGFKGKLKCLDFKGLTTPKKLIHTPFRKAFPSLDTKFLSLARKEGFMLISEATKNSSVDFSLEYQDQYNFFIEVEKLYSLIEDLPKIIRIDLDGATELYDLKRIFDAAEKIGRLTCYISLSDEFIMVNELALLLPKFNLHYILKTDGNVDTKNLLELMKSFSIVEFTLNDFNKARLKTVQNNIDVEKVFHNFKVATNHQLEFGFPQIGIECNLPSDILVQYEIVNYWFHRIDFSYPVSSFCILGDQTPKIQYIKYFSNDLQGDFQDPIDKTNIHLSLTERDLDQIKPCSIYDSYSF